MSQKLRRATTNQYHRYVIFSFDIRDCDVGVDQIARFFNIGVPARSKIMNHTIERLFFGSRNDGDESGFAKSINGIKNLKGLTGIIGNNKNFFAN